MPTLPKDRVNAVIPFSVIGIDFTGQFNIKTEDGNTSKYYILIFTCLVTRAVHLEALNNMTTEAFLLAFIRFCNRYSIPKIVYCDNAKTFVSGGNILYDICTSDEFLSKFKPYSIRFKYIPTYSPWHGAVYERMIKTVKLCIAKTIHRKTLDYFNFLTLLSDVQHVLNDRPLTYRSVDNNIDVITPNHFLKLHSDTPSLIITSTDKLPDAETCEDESYDPYNRLITSLDIRQQLIAKFYDVWLRNYVLSLKRSKGEDLSKNNESLLKIGNVGLFQTPNKKRPHWKLIKIVEHIASSDGKLRSVKIKTHDGSIITTSIANIIPLELCETRSNVAPVGDDQLGDITCDPLSTSIDDLDEPSINDDDNRRPSRAAAKTARLASKLMLEDEDSQN